MWNIATKSVNTYTIYNNPTFFDKGGKNSALMTTICSQGHQEILANKLNPLFFGRGFSMNKIFVKCTRADSLTV